MILLKEPQNGAVVDLQTDTQKEFLKLDRSDVIAEAYDYLNLKKLDKKDNSFPEKVKLEWVCEGECTVELSENELFTPCYSYIAVNFVEVENLKGNTRYFWRVICKDEISDTFFFDTSDMFPRFIRVDGVTNVRDCGGWKTTTGKRIKQGMIYRGTEMNNHLSLTDEGKKMLKEFLGLRSVIDLRGNGESAENAYGENYINIPIVPYRMWLHDQSNEVTKKIFDFIFDESNHPLYFHCYGGADRTGTLSFFIGALLGMSYDDLIDDYEATSLSIFGVRSRNQEVYAKGFLTEFMAMEGETPAEKAENYFVSWGISKEKIEKFRSFMLE